MKNTSKRTIKIFSNIILLLAIFFVSFSFAFAAGMLYFGGRITTVIQCTCSVGSQVSVVGFPSIFSGTYLYVSGVTQIKGRENVVPGRLILGNYSTGGTCLVTGTPCVTLPITKGTMTKIGTN